MDTTTGSNGGGVIDSPASQKVTPAAVQAVAALVLLIAVCTCPGQISNCEPDQFYKNFEYTLAAAIIAMFLAGLIAVMVLKARSTYDHKVFEIPKFGDVTIGYCLSFFIFAWWSVMAGIITFSGPFKDPGNGYFATWVGFVASLTLLGNGIQDMMQAVSNTGSLIGLAACSAITIFAIPDTLGDRKPNQNEAIYAMVIACLSLFVVLVLLAMDHFGTTASNLADVKFFTLGFFAILWVVLACLVTFAGPFPTVSNGYFAAWGGAITSIVAATSAYNRTNYAPPGALPTTKQECNGKDASTPCYTSGEP